MKLGPLQKKWVRSLKKHPERQQKNALGKGSAKEYTACCLGQAGLIMDTCYFRRGILVERDSLSGTVLGESYKKMGLRDCVGTIVDNNISLAGLNDDNNHTWVDIAYLIEAAPELFFTKSV